MKERIGYSSKKADFRAMPIEVLWKKPVNTPEKPIDPLEAIPFDGFSPEQEARVKDQIRRTRLPVENITSVRKRPAVKGQEGMIGSYQPMDGTLTLHGLERIPPQGQQATIIHELSHASSPFNTKNETIYGSPGALKQTQEYVIAVVKQTAATGKYLNGYHAYLYKQLEKGEIDQRRLLEETHAILIEERFKNPAHLVQVEEAQHKTLETKGIKNGVNLLSKQTKDGIALSGVDATIMRLTRIGTYEGLQQHIQNVKESVSPEGKKPISLLNQQSFAKAA